MDPHPDAPDAQPVVFAHRRAEDGEHVGYLEMRGEDFVPLDLLRRERGGPMELTAAEEVLDGIGLRMFAEDWWYDDPEHGWVRVRLQEVTPEAVTIARALEDGSAHVAKAVDLTATTRLGIPTDRLREQPPRAS